ncbi:MAG: hypothetical protein COA74_07445 [Gammaproteobacteria bacterium]|nr:MAG: hypothetical protein COA74_07445 [Gammaproteobacteria bacterium]
MRSNKCKIASSQQVSKTIKQSSKATIFILMSSLFIAACGSSDEAVTSPPPEPAPPPAKTQLNEAQASAFLNRASFGATRESIDALVNSNVEDWFSEQYNLSPTLLLPYILALPDQENIRTPHRVRGWWLNVVKGDDQLRQRVGFALSEIFVASDINGFLFNQQQGMASFYDLLVNNAFGNYRDLLEDVTLHPVMGIYLSMLGNRRPDPQRNIRPDENYAREVMQLFSIGLVMLNQDGTFIQDGEGKAIPTYDQPIIEAFAHVFTGWNFAGTVDFFRPDINMLEPMEAMENFHDTGEKSLLNGLVLPAAQSAYEDLTMALDNIFNHQNVGPFISSQLIQRLVTSNPSPEYVSRVAGVFNDNGSGVRGNLGAVIFAILTDDEALNGAQNLPETFGKLREPLIRNAHFWRVFNAETASGVLPFGWPDFVYGQSPQRAPHVFNFFYPDYAPPGEVSQAGMVAPEFQIASESNLTGMHNAMLYFSIGSYDGTGTRENDDIILELDDLLALANDHQALVDELDMQFTAGQMTPAMKAEIVGYLDLYPQAGLERIKVMEASFLIISSHEYAIQK